MEIRLQKALSEYGIMSRRHAEELISRGKIKVDGKTAVPGIKIDPNINTVKIDGKIISFSARKLIYIILNKPRGYITSVSDEKGRRTVMELVSDIEERIYPVGRLDYDSEGLLIMTNDGEFANKIIHPSNKIEKTYVVTVSGLKETSLEKLSAPMIIDGYEIRPAKAEILDIREKTAKLQIKICEGRNRQIRKMCENTGLDVKRLKRVAIGEIYLKNLAPGKWRHMTEEEVGYIINAR